MDLASAGPIEVELAGLGGGRLPIPTELQQGFPTTDLAAGQLQQLLEVLRSTQLHPARLEP